MAFPTCSGLGLFPGRKKTTEPASPSHLDHARGEWWDILPELFPWEQYLPRLRSAGRSAEPDCWAVSKAGAREGPRRACCAGYGPRRPLTVSTDRTSHPASSQPGPTTGDSSSPGRNAEMATSTMNAPAPEMNGTSSGRRGHAGASAGRARARPVGGISGLKRSRGFLDDDGIRRGFERYGTN